ncbi:ATP-binding protein [Streptomyces sp. NPDC057424]|uniref:ATP-binding protein n=1 Tax=Streptomyces sp. NPDC057424 TaxID=3346127 RepID=UPI00368B42EB
MSSHTAPLVLPRPKVLGAPHCSQQARFTLPAQKALVGCLRAAATDLLTRWRLSDDERDAAVLVVGELAANAATHGRGEMSLCLILAPGRLCIALSDRGEPARSREPSAGDDPDEHGRGLGIVHALAERVDLRHDNHGASVVAWLAVRAVLPRAA